MKNINNIKSVYIHIPFCNKICSYCDFCKMYYNEKWIDNYLDNLNKEIKEKYNNEVIDTLYIGGGTPSSLSIEELSKLFNMLKIFKLNKNCEFTIECNIDDITEEKIKLFKDNNINRISIGIESFNKKHLKLLNRNHNYKDAFKKINLIKKYGINNINADLIYAIPGQTISDLKEDLSLFLNLGITHISTYSLIIEEHTKLYIDGIKNIDEDLDYEMYKYITNTLKNNDFIHYEVSNYSLNGYQSRHNLTYWNNNEYYGFGLGASGYINNIRYTNTRNINKYIEGNYVLEEETIDEKTKIENEMILGLRKIKGINKKDFFYKYHKNIEDVYDIKTLLDNNKIIDDGINIKINEEYIYLSNNILIEFMKE